MKFLFCKNYQIKYSINLVLLLNFTSVPMNSGYLPPNTNFPTQGRGNGQSWSNNGGLRNVNGNEGTTSGSSTDSTTETASTVTMETNSYNNGNQGSRNNGNQGNSNNGDQGNSNNSNQSNNRNNNNNGIDGTRQWSSNNFPGGSTNQQSAGTQPRSRNTEDNVSTERGNIFNTNPTTTDFGATTENEHTGNTRIKRGGYRRSYVFTYLLGMNCSELDYCNAD